MIHSWYTHHTCHLYNDDSFISRPSAEATTVSTTEPTSPGPPAPEVHRDEAPYLEKEESVDRAEVPRSDRSFWSIAWEAHVYFAGTLFALMAVYCTGKTF